MTKKFLFLFTFLLSLNFVSCNFFSQGTELKDKIDTIIDYINQVEVTIRFSNDGGAISPAGDVTYKVTDPFFLSYTDGVKAKNCFVCWEVYNKKTKTKYSEEDVKKLLDFEDIYSMETNVKILTDNPNLLIKAKSVTRPTVAAPSPSYDSAGVYRDRRIDVLFTRKMDPSSIYFDDNEIKELESQGYEPLYDTTRKNNCYGYKDSEGNRFFKNIKISNRTNEDINYLEHYEAPFFEENDSSILRINVDMDNPPPTLADIYVTIDKAMFYKDSNNNIDVPMAEDFSWSYYTNSLVDKEGPNFVEQEGETKFQVYFAKDNQEDYDKNQPVLLQASSFTKAQYKTNNLKNHQIWVKGCFDDGGSGPERLEWTIYKINSPYYPQASDREVANGKVDNLIVTGSNARIARSNGSKIIDGTCLDITDFTNKKPLDEGFYRIEFVAYDKNQRASDKKIYYFVHDVTPPANVTGISETRNSASAAVLSCKNGNFDVQKIVLKSRNMTNASSTVADVIKDDAANNATLSFSVSGLKDRNKYAHSFELTDICGNTVSYSEPKDEFVDTTKPKSQSSVSVSSSYAIDSADLKVTNSSSNYSYSKIGDVEFTNSSNTKRVSGMGTSSRTHTITVTDYDFSGNSVSYTRTISTTPSIGMIVYSDMYWSTDYVSSRTPVGVICKIPSLDEIIIWDVDENKGTYCWSSDPYDDIDSKSLSKYWDYSFLHYSQKINQNSGLDWLEFIKGNKKGEGGEYNSRYYSNQKDTLNNPATIFYYVSNKNSFNSKVKWFIPSILEYKYIGDNMSTLESAFSKMSKTCFTRDEPYWTCIPTLYYSDEKYESRYRIKQHAIVVTIGKDKIEGNGTFHQMSSISGGESLWVSDPEQDHTSDYWIKNKARSDSRGHDIYTHAMGQVNLNY